MELEDSRLTAHRAMSVLKPSEVDLPKVEKVSVSDLLVELEKGDTVNAMIEESRSKLGGIEDEVASVTSEIAEFETKILALKESQKALSERIEKGTAICSKLEDVDVAAIRVTVASAEATNEKAAAYAAHMKSVDDYQDKKIEHEEISEQIKALKEKKKAALEDAKWPIEGLSVDDNKVYYNDCLLENLGESEQMLVCCALAKKDIMANPLRVVRLDGIESMSKEHFEQLTAMFNGDGIQVLSTRVARAEVEPGEIQIVDGSYKG